MPFSVIQQLEEFLDYGSVLGPPLLNLLRSQSHFFVTNIVILRRLESFENFLNLSLSTRIKFVRTCLTLKKSQLVLCFIVYHISMTCFTSDFGYCWLLAVLYAFLIYLGLALIYTLLDLLYK